MTKPHPPIGTRITMGGRLEVDGAEEMALSGSLAVGEVIDIGFAYTWVAETWYIVTVVCKDGTTVAQSFQAS